MRKLTAIGAVAAIVAFSGCDDGRQDRIPGAQPAREVPEAETPWDTLHPPVPPAPGVEAPATGSPPAPAAPPAPGAPAGTGTPPGAAPGTGG
jgi:hypothetical protein